MSEPITESIVTPEWIAAVRTNYGLDTRTPFEAGAVWAAHGVVAGAVTALGHALDRIEALERLHLATPELIADAERYQKLKARLHCADFAYATGEGEITALVFRFDPDTRVSADLDAIIDAARAAGGVLG